MEIQQSAIAGTLESSDVQVTIEPNMSGVVINIESTVKNQYGRQIKETVLNTLSKLNIQSGNFLIDDKGALECTLKARLECAIFRSCGKSDAGIAWGDLEK